MSELIHYKYVCRIQFSDRKESESFEFINLEDLLFHISFIITTKQFIWFKVERTEISRDRV